MLHHRGRPVSNIKVEMELRHDKHVRQVTLLTPDGPGTPNPPYTLRQGRVKFIVPMLATYTLVVIRLG